LDDPETLQVFSESRLYEKYFAEHSSLPNPHPKMHDMTRLSNKRRRSRSPTPPTPIRPRRDAAPPRLDDPFATDDTPETEELVLQQDPYVSIRLPNRLLSRAEWIEILLDASSRVLRTVDADTKRNEYARGGQGLAELLLPHPQLPLAIRMTLLSMYPQLHVALPLSLPPTFEELDRFIGRIENSRSWILGNLAGEEIQMIMSGDVVMGEGVEESFEGKVVVDFGDEQIEGLVLGHVHDTGTAILALADMRLVMYNAPNAAYPPWNGLRRQKSAFYWTEGNEISLAFIELKEVVLVEEEM
jgi:hypothetical protein